LRKAAASSEEALTCMAEIVGVHGVKGIVKLKIFSDNPESLIDYAPLCDSSGQPSFKITSLHQHGNIWLAELDGLKDRTAAEKLRGTKLYVSREELPKIKNDNTYYHADLIGMAALYPDGKPMGRVINVSNFGAGDLLEVKPVKGTSFYVPFTARIVTDVDMKTKEVTIDPPPGLID
jgi:16S rRNA processing protein RimM